MRCPGTDKWDLLAAGALDGELVERLLAHARQCPACRERYQVARQTHTSLVRMYEAFDRDHDELREQLMAALPAGVPARGSARRFRLGGRRLGDLAMRISQSRPRRVAALLVPAACIVALVSVFVVSGQQSAFAAALERIQAARTIVCHVTMPQGAGFGGLPVQAEGTLYVSSEYGTCFTMRANGMLLAQSYAPPGGPVTVVQPTTRTYMEIDVSQLDPEDVSPQTPGAFLEKLAELKEDAATELQTREIEGRQAIGYRIPGEKLGFGSARDDKFAAHAELWVDVDTNLPVRFSVSVPMPEQERPVVVQYEQFQWDVPLEASLFEPKIGDDYTLLDMKLSRPTEQALVNTLDKIRTITGGQYPSDFSPVSVMTQVFTMPRSPEGHKLLDNMGQQEMIQFAAEISAGTMYYMKLIRQGREPEYFGDAVTAADADKVLVRWRLDDGRIRVIYGDLHRATLPAEKTPAGETPTP